MRGSVTFDNDTCFARHMLLRGMLSATTYFCDAYASWQKGGVENANGRIRRWLPRGTDLDEISEDDIQEIAMTINLTPRRASDTDPPSRRSCRSLAGTSNAGCCLTRCASRWKPTRSRSAMSSIERLGHRTILGKPYADKDRQEALITDSDLDWTIVRPVILTKRPRPGRVRFCAILRPGGMVWFPRRRGELSGRRRGKRLDAKRTSSCSYASPDRSASDPAAASGWRVPAE